MKLVCSILVALACVSGVVLSPGVTSADVTITEVSSSNNFGEDWFEVTNLTDAVVDLTGFYWDDNGPMGNDGAEFLEVELQPGESLIVLEGGADAADAFRELFGLDSSVQILTEEDVTGPDTFSGLSSNGDEITLFDTDPNVPGAEFNVVDFVEFPAANLGVSFDFTSGSPVLSVAGVNGAITASNGDVGSPGTVPTSDSDSDSDPVLLGDVNTDGLVNFLDISPFIAVLSAGEAQAEADINESGEVNFLDISPFINVLSQGN